MDILDKLNIEIEEFGTSSFRVVSHPTWFINGKEEDIVRQIIDLILVNKLEEVEVPNTNLDKDYKKYIISLAIGLVGLGIIIYEKKKRK